MFNNAQMQKIFLSLNKAKALQFLFPKDILELANELNLDIKISRGRIYFNGCFKKLDSVEFIKTKGIWTPAFWIWFLSTFIEIDTNDIIVDFDAITLDYCKTIFKAHMDLHSNHQ